MHAKKKWPAKRLSVFSVFRFLISILYSCLYKRKYTHANDNNNNNNNQSNRNYEFRLFFCLWTLNNQIKALKKIIISVIVLCEMRSVWNENLLKLFCRTLKWTTQQKLSNKNVKNSRQPRCRKIKSVKSAIDQQRKYFV